KGQEGAWRRSGRGACPVLQPVHPAGGDRDGLRSGIVRRGVDGGRRRWRIRGGSEDKESRSERSWSSSSSLHHRDEEVLACGLRAVVGSEQRPGPCGSALLQDRASAETPRRNGQRNFHAGIWSRPASPSKGRRGDRPAAAPEVPRASGPVPAAEVLRCSA
ncbi:unnamed protein product, partial [Effrenium voratum]